jgi:mannose-6-phosphate isomerase-like protein (cupin superfamily)
MVRSLACFGSLLLFALNVAMAQAPPTNASRHATLVSASEITAAVQRGDTTAVADAVLRVLPIEGEYNIGISVVRRSRVNGRTPPDAIVHEAVTEVYHIVEGRGVLVTGGTVDGAAALSSDNPIVVQLVGPSSVGKSISGGTRQLVGPGDVVVIPPHTAHGFVEISTDRIVYLLVRVDPHRVLETRSGPR